MNTYKIADISEADKWIYIESNKEDSINESEVFVELVKSIAIKWNNNEWAGKIYSIGEIRYKVKNDPLNLVYQWDDLYGIVFEYKDGISLDMIKSFISDNYNIK